MGRNDVHNVWAFEYTRVARGAFLSRPGGERTAATRGACYRGMRSRVNEKSPLDEEKNNRDFLRFSATSGTVVFDGETLFVA